MTASDYSLRLALLHAVHAMVRAHTPMDPNSEWFPERSLDPPEPVYGWKEPGEDDYANDDPFDVEDEE